MLTETSISPQAPLPEPELDALAGLALLADHIAHALQLLGHALVGGDDVVEGVGDLAGDAGLVAGQADGKVAGLHRLQRLQKLFQRPGRQLRRIVMAVHLGHGPNGVHQFARLIRRVSLLPHAPSPSREMSSGTAGTCRLA